LKRGEAVLFDGAATSDTLKGNSIAASIASGKRGEPIRLTIATIDGRELIAAATQIK
jgi:hypothetical protein